MSLHDVIQCCVSKSQIQRMITFQNAVFTTCETCLTIKEPMFCTQSVFIGLLRVSEKTRRFGKNCGAVYFAAYGQSATSSWCRALLWGP
jgi:hypothetical protein